MKLSVFIVFLWWNVIFHVLRGWRIEWIFCHMWGMNIHKVSLLCVFLDAFLNWSQEKSFFHIFHIDKLFRLCGLVNVSSISSCQRTFYHILPLGTRTFSLHVWEYVSSVQTNQEISCHNHLIYTCILSTHWKTSFPCWLLVSDVYDYSLKPCLNDLQSLHPLF